MDHPRKSCGSSVARCVRIAFACAVLVGPAVSGNEAWGADEDRSGPGLVTRMLKGIRYWTTLGSAGGDYGTFLNNDGLQTAEKKVLADTASPTMRRAVQAEQMLLQRSRDRLQQGKGPTRNGREKTALRRMQSRERHRLGMMVGWEYDQPNFESAMRKQISLLADIGRARGELPVETASTAADAFSVLHYYVVTNWGYVDRVRRTHDLFNKLLAEAQSDPNVQVDAAEARNWQSQMDSILADVNHRYHQQAKKNATTLILGQMLGRY